jgi:hypothetical protein
MEHAALDELRRRAFDCLPMPIAIMDVDTHRFIDGNPAVPVFVTTGYADDPVIANPNAYGFTGGIAKPFTIQELSHLLIQRLSIPVKK